MNTRTYPRTLNQAFPKTADYAASIERSRPCPRGYWPAMLVIALVAALVIGATS